MMTHRILILGGTSEARQLAGRLAVRNDFDVTLSLAGRTIQPIRQPVPVRIGGFGGAAGLARHLTDAGIRLVIDATHPFAARISGNAALAAKATGIPLLALRRPAWEPVAGDRWTMCDTISEAVTGLGATPRRVLVALGRQELEPLVHAPQHFYLIRSVDPIEPPLEVPRADYILARGPFAEEDEKALLAGRGIDAIVAKNSGGPATYGKIAAARALGIDVHLVSRPHLPETPSAETVAELVAMIDHVTAPLDERGE